MRRFGGNGRKTKSASIYLWQTPKRQPLDERDFHVVIGWLFGPAPTTAKIRFAKFAAKSSGYVVHMRCSIAGPALLRIARAQAYATPREASSVVFPLNDSAVSPGLNPSAARAMALSFRGSRS